MTAFLVCCWSRNCMVDCISSKLMSNSFREVSCFKLVLSLTVTDLSGPGFCPIYIGRFTEAFPQTARLSFGVRNAFVGLSPTLAGVFVAENDQLKHIGHSGQWHRLPGLDVSILIKHQANQSHRCTGNAD